MEDQNASLIVFLPVVPPITLTEIFSTTIAMLAVKTQEFGEKGTTGCRLRAVEGVVVRL